MEQSIPNSKLKTGQRPVQVNLRGFKPGDTLFEEGSLGKEMFMIQGGTVGVYKNTPDGTIELARVEKGAIIGEMSLLDNMPRSATVKAISETQVMVVNQLMFSQAMQQVPLWLQSIIKIVVSRLRDANKRVDQAILRNQERGFVSLILLLLPSCKYEYASSIALDYDTLVVEAYFVCRLKKKEIKNIITSLEKRQLVTIAEDANHKRHTCIRDFEAFTLFDEFLKLKSQQKKFREIEIPEDVVGTLSNIAYVAQKSGVETEEGTALRKSALIEDMKDKDQNRLDKSLLDLRRRGLINIMPEGTETVIVFRKETLTRIKKIKEWLPRFEMTIPVQ